MENQWKIVQYILTGERELIRGMFNRTRIEPTRKSQSAKHTKTLSRRQRKAQQGDGLGAERELYKYTEVRSYSHKIEEIGKIYGGYVQHNTEKQEFNPRQSPCHLSCEVRNAGPQPLRHFGL